MTSAGYEARQRASSRLAASCIPARYRKPIGEPDSPEGIQWAEKRNSVLALPSGAIVALVGKRGTGKTQLACEALIETCRHASALYTTAIEFFLAIRAAFRADGDSEEKVIRRFANPAMLVIDEIHERGESQWEDRMLTHVLDRRYRELRTTIVIANLTALELAKSLGPSIMDRLAHTGMIASFDYAGFRRAST